MQSIEALQEELVRSQERIRQLETVQQPYTVSQFERLKKLHQALKRNALQGYKVNNEKNPDPFFDDYESERTFRNDIIKLKEYAENQGQTVSFNRSNNRYECTGNFSLFRAMFPDEKRAVEEIETVLEWIISLPNFKGIGLESEVVKIIDTINGQTRPDTPYLFYDANEYYSGIKWLGQLYQAIREKHRVKISYVDFSNQLGEFEFSPYFLKEYKNRWHVYGWNHTGAFRPEQILNIALDRITGVLSLPLTSRSNSIDWEAYFANIVGFTRIATEPLQEFRVRVWYPRANYVLTKPIHNSQRAEEGMVDGQRYVDLTFNLHWNLEFEAALLELGPDALLISPTDKRDQMAAKASMLATRYHETK